MVKATMSRSLSAGIPQQPCSHVMQVAKKATMASQKAYIATKLENGKESCLVNINVAKGETQASVVAKLMDQLVHDSSLNKAKLVDLKNQLLREGA